MHTNASTDEIRTRIGDLETADPADAAEIAAEVAKALGELLDAIEPV